MAWLSRPDAKAVKVSDRAERVDTHVDPRIWPVIRTYEEMVALSGFDPGRYWARTCPNPRQFRLRLASCHSKPNRTEAGRIRG